MAEESAQPTLPVEISDGWPERVGEVVYASEAGIMLGDFMLPGLIEALRNVPDALVVRIDPDVQPEQWMLRPPDGQTAIDRTVTPPATPTAIPQSVADDRALSDWIHVTHGSFGRLIVADPKGTWWVVNDAELELSLICGSRELVATLTANEVEERPFEWLPDPSLGDGVVARYHLDSA